MSFKKFTAFFVAKKSATVINKKILIMNEKYGVSSLVISFNLIIRVRKLIVDALIVFNRFDAYFTESISSGNCGQKISCAARLTMQK